MQVTVVVARYGSDHRIRRKEENERGEEEGKRTAATTEEAGRLGQWLGASQTLGWNLTQIVQLAK